MPLQDSLGSSEAIKLPKMNSMPTTEDLKFALMQIQKKGGGKVCELPFEHPVNHQTFVVKVTFRPGTKEPNWTLIRGDGAGAKPLWSRAAEVMIIQNKIKIDSQYVESGEQVSTAAQDVDIPSHDWEGSKKKTSIKMGAAPIVMKQEYNRPGDPSGPPTLSDAINSFGYGTPAPPTLDAFFGRDYPPQLNAFIGQPSPEAPAGRKIAQEPPSFVPPSAPLPGLKSLDRTSEYGTQPQAPVTPAHTPVRVPVPAPVLVREPAVEPVVARPVEPAKPKPPSVPLPPPIKFDKKIVNEVHRLLANEETGMMSYSAFVFFLFREFVRFQKRQTPFSIVIFEIAVRGNSGMLPLPPSAVTTIADCVRRVCGPLDILTHLHAGEFGALVPCANGDDAVEFASSLNEALTENPVSLGGQESTLVVAAGAASIPETCGHPEVLVAAARQAKEMAKVAGMPYMLFPAWKDAEF